MLSLDSSSCASATFCTISEYNLGKLKIIRFCFQPIPYMTDDHIYERERMLLLDGFAKNVSTCLVKGRVLTFSRYVKQMIYCKLFSCSEKAK